ncbi:hypothetical protein Pla163_10440 [Planctomycetes bacterium Pla163]|uniref:Uncharacterized protein n=1 Tax=Rohdeia mirabilis TaxID=2528008 RepID=A0A518CXI6_9BACT|nr:hypothetical protein Pla163_10440 [Planctomycetes bacterium Pla163]
MHLALPVLAAALTLVPSEANTSTHQPVQQDATAEQDGARAERLAAVRAELAELAAQVAERRGRELTAPVPVELLDPEPFRAALRTQLVELHPQGHFEHMRDAYRSFGILPPEFDGDLLDALLDGLVGNVFGLYSPTRGTILVPDEFDHPLYRLNGGDALRREILAHEVQHALQDRAVGLTDFCGRALPSHDARLARGALMEGDAVATAMDWMLSLGGSSLAEFPPGLEKRVTDQIELSTTLSSIDTGALADPAFLAFSYGTGAGLVHDLVLAGGWERVDAAFADPPASTEQVLHRTKYLDERDWPTAIDLELPPVLELAGWSVLASDTLGELTLRELFASALDDETVVRASFGWDGDRYLLLGRGDERALIWSSVWDSASDARAAHSALAQVLGLEADAYWHDDRPASTRRDAGVTWSGRDGKRVALAVGLNVEGDEDTRLEASRFAVDHALAAPLVHDERDTKKGRGDGRVTRQLEDEALAAIEAGRIVVDGRTVFVRDLDLSLTLPTEQWQVEPKTPMAAVRLVLVRGTPSINFNVSLAPGDGLDRRAVMDVTLEFLESTFQDIEVEVAETVDDPRGPAFRLRYSASVQGTRANFHQLGFARGEDYVVLSCTEFSGTDDPAIELEFDALLDSVTFGAEPGSVDSSDEPVPQRTDEDG